MMSDLSHRTNGQFLVDSFGRRHNNLRISVTDRCNFRCTYCMPEEVTFQPRKELLTFEEIVRFVRVGANLGIDKLRLTGGEPLLRRDLPQLIAMLREIPGIRDLALTTNGLLLPNLAQSLFDAGLRRINISLDSLDPETFRRLTRRDALAGVLVGIETAREVGFSPIKINAVAIRESTPADLVQLAKFCRERDLELRFIEFMPLEADGIWETAQVRTAEEILGILAEAGLPADPLPPSDPSAPAEEFTYRDGRGKLGIVASVSRPFCGNCNRLRITAEGKLRNCLFGLTEWDVRGILRRQGGDVDQSIAALLRESVSAKWAGHQIHSIDFIRPSRTMHAIGG